MAIRLRDHSHGDDRALAEQREQQDSARAGQKAARQTRGETLRGVRTIEKRGVDVVVADLRSQGVKV